MPTTYAHYIFGQEVLKLLDKDLKKSINKNIDLYNIGLHGPDILFYYSPLKSNEISKIGHGLHRQTAYSFFENARKVIVSCPDYDAACAYILGFICHFMLDTKCHPFIRQKESNSLCHGTIETEFDRLFMIKNNLNPVSFKPTSHIVSNKENADVIAWFFDGVSKEDILNALKSMKFYLNLLVAPGYFKRFLIKSGLKLSGNYDSMIGLVMNYEPLEECKEINEKLYEFFLEGVSPAANIVMEYCKNIKSSEKLNVRFNRNFE
ncbi:MAG: zinc dependent phospholipase C family protein [Sedimentibacter sp.]